MHIRIYAFYERLNEISCFPPGFFEMHCAIADAYLSRRNADPEKADRLSSRHSTVSKILNLVIIFYFPAKISQVFSGLSLVDILILILLINFLFRS
jgi:hypothetical protein